MKKKVGFSLKKFELTLPYLGDIIQSQTDEASD